MYSTQDSSAIPEGVPLASCWENGQWPKVCALRAQLDAVLIDLHVLDRSTTEALRELGPMLPCYRIDDGAALYLRLEACEYIHRVPEDIASRLEVERWLDQGSTVPVPALPHARGLFELKGSSWTPCRIFRHRAPSVLLVNEALLECHCEWMILEAGLRAGALGQSAIEKAKIELSVAEWLAETERFPEAPKLLRRHRAQLHKLSH